VAQNEEYILEILLETALITKSQLERARTEKQRDETVIECLIRQGAVSQEDITRALAGHASMDFVDLNGLAIPEEVVGQVPRTSPAGSRSFLSRNSTPA
jgi:general secretion pathway protein E/type IV pilus assembly protein PilB